jgi:biotin carboxylase
MVPMQRRVLILASTRSYRTDDFAHAAERLGLEAVLGTDRCHVLAEIWDREKFGGSLQVELRDSADAARAVIAEGRARPLDAIIPTDDPTAEIAALAARALGLRGNDPEAPRRARNKRLLREALQAAGVPGPSAQVFAEDDPAGSVAARVPYPCVIKPILCSASRGVMRADDPASFQVAWRRLVALLRTPALRAVEDPDGHRILVEPFVPGAEVALEGLLRGGRLTVLALFDKPDPLDGPFFEETIYVTPSRHPRALQEAVAEVTEAGARALGLADGPIHAELRLSPGGPRLIELAARSIGGLCARTLRFGLGETSLEEVVLRNALGLPIGEVDYFGAPRAAAGVMMIPIPRAGVYKGVRGVEVARAVPLVEDLVISAHPGQVLVPLPEGHAYLGFLFARGQGPAEVEAALRRAHAALVFEVAPTLTPRTE